MGELIKIFGPYHELYYPYKSAIVGQLTFIIVLYVPFFANYHMVRRMIRTNVRLIYPAYDFKTGRILVGEKHEKSDERSPSAEHLTAAELDSLVNAPSYGNQIDGGRENRNDAFKLDQIEEEANDSRSARSNENNLESTNFN